MPLILFNSIIHIRYTNTPATAGLHLSREVFKGCVYALLNRASN